MRVWNMDDLSARRILMGDPDLMLADLAEVGDLYESLVGCCVRVAEGHWVNISRDEFNEIVGRQYVSQSYGVDPDDLR